MSDPSPLTERQLQLLADRLFQAAVANTDKAADPPDPSEQGEFVAASASNFAKAALSLTQALMTVANRSRR